MIFTNKGRDLSAFVISLDFELFWGVSDSRSIENYRRNIEGSLVAIPRMLEMFQRYQLKVTWAVVGMAICRDFSQWQEVRPSFPPGYIRKECSNYSIANLAREYPHLFFARPTVERILEIESQELATHTYSHFYCGEMGASPEQFAADLDCAKLIGAELGITFGSIVFPRNQVKQEYLSALQQSGIKVFRGNSKHPLYADGHVTPGGIAGRAVRFGDSWINLTGTHTAIPEISNGLVNVPASMFLRPYSHKLSAFEALRIYRIKSAMDAAAKADRVFHLWWHPHNFGLNIDQNLATLEVILQHYQHLRDTHGMRSMCMGDFACAEVA